MQFTGSIVGLEAFTLVEITHGSGATQEWMFNTPGSYNETIVSEAFVHGGSPQDITVRILSSYQMDTQFYDEGAPVFGLADFGNTLEVIGIDLRDDAGNLLTGDSVVGDSGSTYTIMAVPEPSSVLLSGLGLAGLLLRRRW